MAMPVIKGEKTAGERFPGAVEHLHHRSDDAGPQGAAGRHVALPRAELLEGAGDQVPERSRRAGVRLDDELGRVDAADRRPDHDPLRRRRPGAAAEAGAGARRDHADLPQRRREGAACCRTARRCAASSPPSSTRASQCACASTTATSAAATRSGSGSRRGVPVRLEIGPRDIEGGTLMPGAPRLDRQAGRRSPATSSSPNIAKTARRHSEVALRPRRRSSRKAATVQIDSLAEFEKFFTPKNAEEPRNPRRPGLLPLRRLARDGREAQGAEGDGPLHARRRRGRAGQVHLHGPAEHAPRRVREGVLSRLMGDVPCRHRRCLLLIAASSRYDARARLGPAAEPKREFGPVAAVSDAFDFTETNYYAAEMGAGLKKQFWAFAEPIDPGRLAAIKLHDQLVGGRVRRRSACTPSRGRSISTPATSRSPSWCSPRPRTTPTASTWPTASTPR